jgi:aromatic-L-amino-acid decarboxylase
MAKLISESKEETLDPKDWESMRALGHQMLDDSLDYIQNLRQLPVWVHAPDTVKTHFVTSPPLKPQSPQEIYEEYVEYILPHHIGLCHPRFWGWVGGTGTVMGAYAELLAAMTNSISGAFSFISPNYVEMQVLDWFKELLGFPSSASGQLTGGCSAANLIGLAVGRNTHAGFNVRREGLSAAPQMLTLYASEQAHSSIQKAVELLGLGSDALRSVPVNEHLEINLAMLEKQIKQDKQSGFHPFCVVGVAGTTNTGAIDDLDRLADICSEHNLWFHVDGAFGAWAAITPSYQHLVSGLERADSLAFDLHKWMYIPYPIGCVLVKNEEMHRGTFSLTPTYLSHGEGERGLTAVDVPWLVDYGFDLSRGFSALKAWMTIKEQGISKYRRLITQNIEQAHYLADLVEKASNLELALPVSLNVVCFRFSDHALDDSELNIINKNIEIELQERGLAVVSSVVIQNKNYLHTAITNHRTRREDLRNLVRDVILIGTGQG